jgi:hypothetical protein
MPAQNLNAEVCLPYHENENHEASTRIIGEAHAAFGSPERYNAGATCPRSPARGEREKADDEPRMVTLAERGAEAEAAARTKLAATYEGFISRPILRRRTRLGRN